MTEEPIPEINPNEFQGTPEYRKRMHSINLQIAELANWIAQNSQGQIVPQASTNARLEKFMLYLIDCGVITPEGLEEFNIGFAEGFLSDMQNLRGQVQKWITQQSLLQGVPGVDPNAGMSPGARLLQGKDNGRG